MGRGVDHHENAVERIVAGARYREDRTVGEPNQTLGGGTNKDASEERLRVETYDEQLGFGVIGELG